MKLLIVGGSPATKGGVDAFGRRVKEALEQSGHQVILLSAYSAFLTPAKLPDYLRGLAALRQYRKAGIDFLWLQYTNLPDLLYLWVGKMLGLTVVVTPHLGSNWKSQRNVFLRALSGWLLRAADRIALLSRTQELEIRLPDNVSRSYIRTFLPANIWSTPPPDAQAPPELRLIHAARLSAGKGTFLFLDICKMLADNGVAFSASLAGTADEATMAQMKSVIAGYGLGDKVHLLGFVSPADMPALLRTSDVLAHISKIDSYPLIVLESIACGVFPVCLDLPGAKDMVDTYDGHVVPEEGVVAAIAEFLTRHQTDELRQRGRAVAAQLRTDYDWKTCIRILEEMFDLTAGNARR